MTHVYTKTNSCILNTYQPTQILRRDVVDEPRKTISTGRAAALAHVSRKMMRRYLTEDGPMHLAHGERPWADGRVRRIIYADDFEAWMKAHER